ncbi:alpha/beta hydrolase [Sulfobacillus harzensis]|uniref:Alpha/beta hydrolase n=1 Tax=Sulfobacillus harzensis TaxID=2729629 RepID=A0A7Y0L728_9FIRM|nr:alpha/beta hydrolase [Sulfobacillus harzensis]NMP24524.1 alpha/beta hydrolase [Sulfobacillus harzensis]
MRFSRFSRILLWAVLGGMLLSGVAVSGTRRPTPVRVRRWNTRLLGQRQRIVYERVDHQPVTLYLFRPDHAGSKKRPVVVYIHGGALRYGTARISNRNTPHNRLLVMVERKLIQEGDDFVTINYRLAPLYPWPEPLHDARRAVRYLSDHATHLRIDNEKMAVMGDSAGGQLSAFVGLTLETEGPYPQPIVEGVVDLFGPTDRHAFALQWRRRHGLEPNPVFGVMTWERVKNESAVSYVHRGAPPFLIIQGTRDRIVPPRQSQLLRDKLAQAGVPVEEVLVKHAGHELVDRGGPINPPLTVLADQINDFFLQIL